MKVNRQKRKVSAPVVGELPKKFKPLRRDQIEVGVILEDFRGNRREVIAVNWPMITLSHKGTHFVEGHEWNIFQLMKMGDRIVYRPKKEKTNEKEN